MNGATAVPLNTANMLIKNKIMIIGNNHHFFLSRKNSQKSFKNSIFVLLLFNLGRTPPASPLSPATAVVPLWRKCNFL